MAKKRAAKKAASEAKGAKKGPPREVINRSVGPNRSGDDDQVVRAQQLPDSLAGESPRRAPSRSPDPGTEAGSSPARGAPAPAPSPPARNSGQE
jgi:hypothetical protein